MNIQRCRPLRSNDLILLSQISRNWNAWNLELGGVSRTEIFLLRGPHVNLPREPIPLVSQQNSRLCSISIHNYSLLTFNICDTPFSTVLELPISADFDSRIQTAKVMEGQVLVDGVSEDEQRLIVALRERILDVEVDTLQRSDIVLIKFVNPDAVLKCVLIGYCVIPGFC